MTMTKTVAREFGYNPLADILGLVITERKHGFSRAKLKVEDFVLNPHMVVSGAATFAMADNGMGAALSATLDKREFCSTIEIKINFMRPVAAGDLICDSRLIHRHGATAMLESEISSKGKLIAKAQGTFAIGQRKNPKGMSPYVSGTAQSEG